MEICYVCGKRLYSAERCPHCGLTFCEAHLSPNKHRCLTVAQESGERRARFYTVVEVLLLLAAAAFLWFLVNSGN